MASTFGRFFRVTTWGESHGPAVGVVVDGCPAGAKIDLDAIAFELTRRRPGQSRLVTQRDEPDVPEVLSGVVRKGGTLRATGAPIAILVRNRDARGKPYDAMKDLYRPSHADFTYEAKYGLRDPYGGGRASARETVARVAAGAIARRLLAEEGVEIYAFVSRVHTVASDVDPLEVDPREVEKNPVRAPNAEAAARMARRIEGARKKGDSVGGVVTGVAKGVPAGWGDPVFDKLEAELAKAMLSLPATKGFEIGSGFAGTRRYGSEHNDPFVVRGGKVRTTKNDSGGVQGGISNGMPIVFRVAFKPTSTIAKPQRTVDRKGRAATLLAKGRHDPCVLPRAVPIVEAMTALVLVDAMLAQRAVR